MSDESPIRKNEGFDQCTVWMRTTRPGEDGRGDQGHDPLPPRRDERRRGGAAFARRSAAGEPDVGPLFFEVRAAAGRAQAPRWAPPQEDADLARALAASRADMQRPPPVPSVDADLERALAASVAESYAPSYVQSTADIVDDDADDDFDLRRALAASLQETRPATSYYAPPAEPRPRAAAPAGRAARRGVAARDGHLAAPRGPLRAAGDQPRRRSAVERADLEGLLSEPDIRPFLRWQRRRRRRRANTRVPTAAHGARFRPAD